MGGGALQLTVSINNLETQRHCKMDAKKSHESVEEKKWRSQGIICFIYLDDTLLLGSSKSSQTSFDLDSRHFGSRLQSQPQKSVCWQVINHLGFVLVLLPNLPPMLSQHHQKHGQKEINLAKDILEDNFQSGAIKREGEEGTKHLIP
jgi:hypothetical protein